MTWAVDTVRDPGVISRLIGSERMRKSRIPGSTDVQGRRKKSDSEGKRHREPAKCASTETKRTWAHGLVS